MKTEVTEDELPRLLAMLKAARCPVQENHTLCLPPLGITIRRIPEFGTNSVFETKDWKTGFVFNLLIRNELEKPNRIRGFELTPPWALVEYRLLPKPAEPCESYLFPNATLDFHKTAVLNPIFAGKEALIPRIERNGLLLAIADQPIPDAFRTQRHVVVGLTVFDNRGNKFRRNFEMTLESQRLKRRSVEKRAQRFRLPE